MALYPKAKYRPVVGLVNDPPIIPIGVILHTRVGTGPSLFDYFNGPSGGIESHFYLTFDGHWEQYRDTEREADANLHANSFIGSDGKRYGFLSIETEGFATDEWSPTQLAEIEAFLLWAHTTHGIPLRVCPAWNQAGIGYHTMWGAPGPWTPVAKDCPGAKRINQFNTVLVPWLKNPTVAEADDLPYTEDQIRALAAEGVLGSKLGRSDVTVAVALQRIYGALSAPDTLAAAVAAKVQAAVPDVPLDPSVVKDAVKAALREGVQ